MDDDKIVNYKYICGESDLPKCGWIHACLNCHLYTSRYILYDIIEHNNELTEYHIILCPNCKRKFKNDNKFKNKVYKYILNNYDI
jgi:hypothetical protein